MKHRAVLFLVTALLLSVTVHANQTTMYTWKDAQGNVYFGDQASANTDAEEMTVKTQDPAGAAPSPSASEDEQREQRVNKEGSQACDDARKQLDEYSRAPFLYETSPDGKRRIVTEAERQVLLKNVKEKVKSACGG